LPVVAGNSGGVADIVVPGITGVLVPAGDPVAFAAALGALLRDPVLRRRMGKAARDNVWRDHDLAPAASRLAAALTRLGPAKAA
jgi:glycosyltransferase involved in cell wall biosynthesis